MIFVTWGNWRGVPTSFSSPVWFLKAWPRTPLPYRVWMLYFFLTGWLVAGCSWLWLAGLGWLGWLAAGCVADWLVPGGWLAGWAWLAGWLGWPAAGWLYIYYCIWLWMAGIWWMWAPGFIGMNLTSFWPRFDLVLDLVPVLPLNLHLLYWSYHPKRMKIKCLPRIRGVPTSFYHLNMMFSTNRVLPNTTFHFTK